MTILRSKSVLNCFFTLYLTETHFNAFADRAGPDQTAIISLGRRELMSSWCHVAVIVLCLFINVSWAQGAKNLHT